MARVLITGTSSGIGEAAALTLAQAGHAVVATVRTPTQADRLEAIASTAGTSLTTRVLDLTDGDSLASTLADLEAAGPLDVLINNAGVGVVGTLEDLSMDDLRSALEVNFFAVAHATKLVLPGMRAAGAGRIITVTSVGGVVGQPFFEAYCASKFAIEGLMESLAPTAATQGIFVSVLEPGPVATSFKANERGVDALTVGDPAKPYAAAKTAYLSRAGTQFGDPQSPEEVANLLAEIVVAPVPRFRYQTSPWAQEYVRSKLVDLDGTAVTSMTAQWLT